jgi:dynein heavy chain
MIRLWMHEANRVYRDKLVEEEDISLYDKILKDVVKKSFEV